MIFAASSSVATVAFARGFARVPFEGIGTDSSSEFSVVAFFAAGATEALQDVSAVFFVSLLPPTMPFSAYNLSLIWYTSSLAILFAAYASAMVTRICAARLRGPSSSSVS